MTQSLAMVVALSKEARPLIDHYKMKNAQSAGPFPHFVRDNLHLWVSGMGKVNAAAAVAWAASQQPVDAWLNVGICGHADAPLNTPLLIHKCTDQSSGTSYFPSIAFSTPLQSSDLVTVDALQAHYPDDSALDMEAAGFFPTAYRFCAAELVHSIKSVSDNREQDLSQLKKEHIGDFIAQILPQVEHTQQQLLQLAAQLPNHQALNDCKMAFLNQWRFTSTQQSQLQRLLERHWALLQCLPSAETFSCSHSKAVIAELTQRLAIAHD